MALADYSTPAASGTKMRAKVNPTEKLRECYDNNSQIVSAMATLMGRVLRLSVLSI